MPVSMAACRTFLPFSTLSSRPSIVTVIVSIQDYFIRKDSPARLPDEDGGRGVVFIDPYAAKRAADRDALGRDLLGDGHRDLGARVGILQCHRDRQLEHLADLLE